MRITSVAICVGSGVAVDGAGTVGMLAGVGEPGKRVAVAGASVATGCAVAVAGTGVAAARVAARLGALVGAGRVDAAAARLVGVSRPTSNPPQALRTRLTKNRVAGKTVLSDIFKLPWVRCRLILALRRHETMATAYPVRHTRLPICNTVGLTR